MLKPLCDENNIALHFSSEIKGYFSSFTCYACDRTSSRIYHMGPVQTQNPDEFVTEVCFPVK